MKKALIALVVIMGIAGFSAVHAADLFGIVTGNDGKPVVIKVVLKDAKEVQVGEPLTTEKNGSYAFKNIKPGTYYVIVGEKNQWKIFVGPGETRRDFLLK
jgi:hypothetical protein